MTYNVNDAVSYLGSSYVAIQSGTNNQPSSSSAFWNVLANKGDQGPAGPQGPIG